MLYVPIHTELWNHFPNFDLKIWGDFIKFQIWTYIEEEKENSDFKPGQMEPA